MALHFLRVVLSLPEIWQSIIEGFKSGHPLVIGPILFIGGAILTWLVRFIMHSTERLSFSRAEEKKAYKFFIPNHIKIFDQNDEDITPEEFTKCKNPISELRRFLLKGDEENKYFFLIAPTGVGKTTFVLNFYRHYYWKSMFSIRPALIVGKIHDRNMRDLIKRIKEKGDKREESWLNKVRYPFSNPERKIILLDALDEYGGKSYKDAAAFWEAFNQQWEETKEELASFKKVIIAVREQFLQYSLKSSDDNEKTFGIESHVINGKEMRYIELQPFTFSEAMFNPETNQVDRYIEKRYKKSEKFDRVKQTRNYLIRNNPQGDGIPLISIPLILYYLEDLDKNSIQQAARESRPSLSQKSLFHEITVNRYDLYTTIINKWLKRETEAGKEAPKEHIKNSFDFCMELAFTMAQNKNESFTNGIATEQFIALEKDFIERKTFFKNFSDRSLLQKSGVGKSALISFVHSTFLEYFLASYALRIAECYTKLGSGNEVVTNRSDVEEENRKVAERFNNMNHLLNGQSYSFTHKMLTDWSWQKAKRTGLIPDPHESKEYSIPFQQKEILNIPDTVVLQKWLNFVESVSPYQFIRDALKNDMEGMLMEEDSNWRKMFHPLEELCIINENFFEQDAPNSSTQEFIRYFKPFVVRIILYEKPVEADDLSCFVGVSNVRFLDLHKLNLSGNCLSYFSASNNSLEQLCIANNNFKDADLIFFKGVFKLWNLDLAGNLLSGECINFFKESFNQLISFYFYDNNNTDDDIRMFFSEFPTSIKWKAFGISHLSLADIIKKFLSNSADSLENLGLVSCHITNDEILCISEFAHLVQLGLRNNKLTGDNFQSFLPSKDTLEWISFIDNDLNSESLDFFRQHHFPKLKNLYIRNCPPQNPIIIKALLDEKGITVDKLT